MLSHVMPLYEFEQTSDILVMCDNATIDNVMFSIEVVSTFLTLKWSNQPHHEKTCLMPYANNKSADQPVHPRSLISIFVVHCLDSKILQLAVAKISRP